MITAMIRGSVLNGSILTPLKSAFSRSCVGGQKGVWLVVRRSGKVLSVRGLKSCLF